MECVYKTTHITAAINHKLQNLIPNQSLGIFSCILLFDYPIEIFMHIPDKKRNAPRRTNQFSGRSQMVDQSPLYRSRGMSVTESLDIFRNQGLEMCQRKFAINQVGLTL